MWGRMGNFTDEGGRSRPDNELEGYIGKLLEQYFVLRPYNGSVALQRERIIRTAAQRFREIPYDPQIGMWNLREVVMDLCPTCEMKSETRRTGETDVADNGKTVAVDAGGLSSSEILDLINTMFGGASDIYKQQMYLDFLEKQRKKQPIQVPEPIAVEKGLPVWVPWSIAGALGVGALALFLLTRKR